MLGLLQLYHAPSFALIVSHPHQRLRAESQSPCGDGYVVPNTIALRKTLGPRNTITAIGIQQYSRNRRDAQRYLNAAMWWLLRQPFSLRCLPVTLTVNCCTRGVLWVHSSDVVCVDLSGAASDRSPSTVNLVSVAGYLPRLVSLDISGASNHGGSLRTVRHGRLLKYCEHLRHLSLRHTSLAHLAMVPTGNLQVLDIVGCANVVDLWPLAGARFLMRLNASQTGIRDIEALRYCPTLRTLMVEGCSALEDLSPLEDCSFLEHVHASFTAVASVHFARSCKALKVVDVCFCVNLHDLVPLTALPNLEEVHARGSNIRFVLGLGSCPNLTKLDLRETSSVLFSRGV